eukprot:TRINITY_DN694_c0_g1_i1.p1 TRINITY_DN694_c0_g1~~TRINITY_DN694_c0_g1_i1.p1  ORF type:complete len:339 (-),score=97.73 TRINITY_DN694_c0_g1_i1:20-1036(-)
MSGLFKKQKMNPKKIGTHDGTFHCDEALACFMLHQTAEFKDAEIVRTRNPEILKTLDIVVDVGAVYDPATHRYDHHQGTFADTFDSQQNIRLSSAGLIYKHFGKEILSKVTGTEGETLELVFQKIYTDFIKAVDAIDNGVSQYDTDSRPRYNIPTDLGSRVSRLNPAWNDTIKTPDEQFKLAMALTGKEFLEAVDDLVKTWLPARSIVEEMVNSRHEIEASGAIAILPQSCPWKVHLFDLEEEKGIQNQIHYVLFGDKNDWRIQSVPLGPSSFDNRAPLPAEWRGIRDEALSQVAGIEGCVFAHATGFIGGNKTKEGVIAMARKALQLTGKGHLVASQ